VSMPQIAASGAPSNPTAEQFVADSPLEGDGFEPSVPGTKEPVFVAEGEKCGTERGQPKRVVSYAVPMVRIYLPPAASPLRTRLDSL
jgi:hypothetical protein